MKITWRDNNLTIEQCARLSGWTVEELEAKLAHPDFAHHAFCRREGSWHANLREGYVLWSSLINIHLARQQAARKAAGTAF